MLHHQPEKDQEEDLEDLEDMLHHRPEEDLEVLEEGQGHHHHY